MTTRIALIAATLALATASAFAATPSTSAPASPAAAAPATPAAPADAKKHQANPEEFAKHKAALVAARAKTDSCIAAANDGKALMGCLKAEHEARKAEHDAMKAQHEGHDGMHRADAPKPVAPAAK